MSIKMLVFYGLLIVSVLSGGFVELDAAVIQVTTTEDLVPGSLRAAITLANTNNQDNTIILPAGTYYLTGSQGEDANAEGDLDILTSHKLTIQGSSKDTTFINGKYLDRVFHALNGDVVFYDITIKNGLNGGISLDNDDWDTKTLKLTMKNCVVDSNKGSGIIGIGHVNMSYCTIRNNKNLTSNGGGIRLSFGLLSLLHCTINNNYAGDSGGAVQVEDCETTVSECTIVNNHAEIGGGGFSIHVCHPVSVVLENSTISGNSAGHIGGGIFNWDFWWSLGSVAVKNCTIFNNVASLGSGIYGSEYDLVDIQNKFTIENTIIAGSTFNSTTGDIDGSMDFAGNNLIGIYKVSGPSDVRFSETDMVGTPANPIDPMLAPLADNGGPTKTHALLWGSPAIDAGNSPDVNTDQRGFDRPVDVPGIVNRADGSDIGAYEAAATFLISGRITYNGHPLANVQISFSNKGGTAISDNNGEYSHPVPWNWSGSVTPGLPGFTFDPSSRTYQTVNSNLENQDYSATALVAPRIVCDPASLYFGADKAGHESGKQSFTVSNGGGGIIFWSASCSESWFSCAPESGVGDSIIEVSIDTGGMNPGVYNGTLTIADPNADNSPQSIAITLTIYEFGSVRFPFGYVDSPVSGSVVSGSIPVTGWALDNIGIRRVSVFREPVEGEPNELAFIDDATFVAGARPDVETLYPDYPDNGKAGWGYMLLTNFLPVHGNGPIVLHIIAEDMEGNAVELATRTIMCDNANAVKPFGAIDTPKAGAIITGSKYINFGWALTPVPNTIPFDGSTINVYLDGVPLGHPVYNQYRQDIATLFPGYNNSDGAVGYFFIDTHAFENGVHTIAWSVTDNAGNTEGIGSRYFSILNSNTTSSARTAMFRQYTYDRRSAAPDTGRVTFDNEVTKAVINNQGRLEISVANENHVISGNLWADGQYRKLPVGSFLDKKNGLFYWHPGPAFRGEYRLVFFIEDDKNQLSKRTLIVTVRPGT